MESLTGSSLNEFGLNPTYTDLVAEEGLKFTADILQTVSKQILKD